MSIEILQGNLLEIKEDALILTVDGASPGLAGNIARAFGRAYPDAWEELEYLVQYPIPLGTSKIYAIDSELECPFRFAIYASTLHHVETLTDAQKIEVMRAALNSALVLASSKLLASVSCGLMSGGWRLSQDIALKAMLETYRVYASGRDNAVRLKIYVLGKKEYQVISEFISLNYPHSIAKSNGYELGFA